MTSFHLKATDKHDIAHIDTWIELAMLRNVENLSLDLVSYFSGVHNYKMYDFFNITNSSVKQLTIALSFGILIIPKSSSVSWTSLQKLTLRCCRIVDETMTKILSGCPLLESLTLNSCDNLISVLDLSKSLRLRSLEIDRDVWIQRTMEIVAPHIHYLRLKNSQFPCTLVDVSSLAEAKMNICIDSTRNINADIQVIILNMLEKLHNVEKLTLGGIFLQILSLAEVRGVLFPRLKVKSLTLKTPIFQYVIPGIERILQNSPDLKKLTVHAKTCNTLPEMYLDRYLTSQGLYPYQCWGSKDGAFWNRSHYIVEPKHVVSFMELMLKNTKTLEKMAVLLEDSYRKFKEILVLTLSHNNNVSVAAVSTMQATLDD